MGYGIVLAPALGAVGVVFLVKNFAPEAKGHGVPEVMDAVYYKKGVIRPVVAAVKSFASATSIGSGGSVGREGPIIQIGAAFASFAGRSTGASRWQRATLVAAGGGAGIAATFNTPIGGVLFAVEVLMNEVSARTLVPVTLATATATYVGRFSLGSHPAFEVPALRLPVVSTIALLPRRDPAHLHAQVDVHRSNRAGGSGHRRRHQGNGVLRLIADRLTPAPTRRRTPSECFLPAISSSPTDSNQLRTWGRAPELRRRKGDLRIVWTSRRSCKHKERLDRALVRSECAALEIEVPEGLG